MSNMQIHCRLEENSECAIDGNPCLRTKLAGCLPGSSLSQYQPPLCTRVSGAARFQGVAVEKRAMPKSGSLSMLPSSSYLERSGKMSFLIGPVHVHVRRQALPFRNCLLASALLSVQGARAREEAMCSHVQCPVPLPFILAWAPAPFALGLYNGVCTILALCSEAASDSGCCMLCRTCSQAAKPPKMPMTQLNGRV